MYLQVSGLKAFIPEQVNLYNSLDNGIIFNPEMYWSIEISASKGVMKYLCNTFNDLYIFTWTRVISVASIMQSVVEYTSLNATDMYFWTDSLGGQTGNNLKHKYMCVVNPVKKYSTNSSFSYTKCIARSRQKGPTSIKSKPKELI